MIVDDSNCNTLLDSPAKPLSLQADSDQRIAKRNDQSVPGASEESLTSLKNQSLLNNMVVNNNSENREKLNSFRNCNINESGNFSSTQKNNSQLSIAPCVKFRKPPKTTISVQVDIMIYVMQ